MSTNGTITLKSFSELASVLDLVSLPAPADQDERATAGLPSAVEPAHADAEAAPESPSGDDANLTDLLAQLTTASAALDAASHADAEAREQAAADLARYETLASQRREAEQALAQAVRVRETAEQLAREAFTDAARTHAARAASVAAAAERACEGALAERARAADELVCRPDLARLLAERRRREEEESAVARAAEAARAERLANGIATARQALGRGDVEEARALLAPLAVDFPTSDEVQAVLDVVRWQAQQLVVAPAADALRAARRVGRRDPENASARLVALELDGLPEGLARQIFGAWAQACSRLVRQRGWHDPLRYAPQPGRGVVFARRAPHGAHVVVSALGLGPDWPVGLELASPRVLRAARPLR